MGQIIRMGSGYHPESSGQVEKMNQLLEQTLRCTMHQLAETRRWVDILPVIEFAVNNTLIDDRIYPILFELWVSSIAIISFQYRDY